MLIFMLVLWLGAESLALGERPEITGRAVAGYQGWFRAQGDGTGLGFRHYSGVHGFLPGSCSIDYWPFMGEYEQAARYPTGFARKDGSVAHVFSSVDASTVRVHFGWMRDYGIGGAMLQRFVVSTRDPKLRASLDRVMGNVRAASEQTGVPWALMYDLSGARDDEVPGRVLEDLATLRADEDFREDRDYLHLNGKPLVAVWGVGFNDGRAYTLDSCLELVTALKADGWSVFLGVPYWWLSGERDTVADPKLREVIRAADMVSPWSVGRYQKAEQAREVVRHRVAEDLERLNEWGVGYAPVVFPGFSWHNLQQGAGIERQLDEIPRAGGRFMWAQASAAVKSGAGTVYLAMFDEMDEGTCLFKVDPSPPVGKSRFLSYGEMEADFYLWLSGRVHALVRGEIEAGAMPVRD